MCKVFDLDAPEKQKYREKKYLNTGEAAQYLGVTRSMIYYYLRSKNPPKTVDMHGRRVFERIELERWAGYANGTENGSQSRTAANNVILLYEHKPHEFSKVICIKCFKRWIAVRPEFTPLEALECENCGAGYVIETGERLNTNEMEGIKR